MGTLAGSGIALEEGQATITAQLGAFTDTAQLTVTEAVLARLQVTPANETAPKGTAVQYTATAVYSDATTMDVTDLASWTSSDPEVATGAGSA